MTYLEALDIVVARTRHERFRWLCSDANPDAHVREGYRALVLKLAGEPVSAPPPTPLVPLGNSIRAAQLGFRRCLYSTHEGCGCSGTHCYHLGRVVGLADCISCLKG